MYIKELYLKDFKSFHEQRFEFRSNLTVITGPNGSGKSNIFDAIIFALGSSSSKSLRYKHITDLVHKNVDSEYALVKIVFSDDTIVERSIVDSSSVFRLNGKRTTLESIESFLRENKISYNGHNIVMQDDIKKIAELNPKELKKAIEDIANISRFDEQKQKTIKNLESVEIKIKDTKIILTERETYLKKLELEKSIIEKYNHLNSQKANLRYNIINYELNYIRNEIEQSKKKLSNIENRLVQEKSNVIDFDKQINLLLTKNKDIFSNIETLNLSLSEYNSKYSVESYKYESINSNLIQYQKKIESINSNLPKISEQKKEFNKKLDLIDSNIKNISVSLESLNIKISKYGSLDTIKSLLEKNSNIQKEAINIQKELDIKIRNLNSNIIENNNKINKVKNDAIQNQNNINRINLANDSIKDKESKVKQLLSEQKTHNDINNDLNTRLNIINQSISELNDSLRSFENQRIKTSSEVEIVKNASLKDNSPIIVNSVNSIDKILEEYESQNQYGTYVFFIEGSDSIGKDVFIKSIMPTKRLSTLNKLLENIDDNIENLNNQIQTSNLESLDLLNQIKNNQKIIIDLSNNIQKLNNEIEFENSIIKDLESRILDLDENIFERLSNENNQYKIQVMELENKKNEINNSYQDLSDLFSSLLSKEKLDSEINKLVLEKMTINNQIEMFSSSLNNLESELLTILDLEKNVKKEYTQLANKISEVNKERDKIIISIEDLKSQLKQNNLLLDDFRYKLNNSSNFIQRADGDMSQIREFLFSRQSELDEKITELDIFRKHNNNPFENISMPISTLRANLIDVESEINNLGNVNMNAIDDYNDYLIKYSDIKSKIDILDLEKQEILDRINKISAEKSTIFSNYYTKINSNFKRICVEFGLGDVSLHIDSSDIDNSGIDILIKRGNYHRYMNSLSGGEKSLVTIAFIFSVVEFEPSPFYIFDEFDAALDFKNTDKVVDYLKSVSKSSQVLVISHNPETVAKADNLIGISKNRLGIASVSISQNNV